MIPFFPRKSELDLFLPRKTFFLTMLVSLSPKFSNPFLLSLLPLLYPALSLLAIMKGPLPQAGGPLFAVYTWMGGAHSIFLKWLHWNLRQPPNLCSVGRFPQGIISCLWRYLVMVGLDYALFGPFIIVRYSWWSVQAFQQCLV